MSIDLAKQVSGICKLLNLNPNTVAEILLRPTTAEVIRYRVNADDRKFVDVSTNKPAIETLHFEINTVAHADCGLVDALNKIIYAYETVEEADGLSQQMAAIASKALAVHGQEDT